MSSLLKNIIFGVLFLLGMSGCDDPNNELKIKQLKKQLMQLNIANKNLEFRISEKNLKIEKLNLEQDALKDDKTEIQVSLAKSEQVFTKKYKKEMERARIELKKELKKERKNIEKEIKDRYTVYMYIAGLIFLSLIALLNWFYKETIDKSEEIKKLEKELDVYKEKDYEFKNERLQYDNDIKELEKKINEGEKNQVVSKIKECEDRREKQLHRIGVASELA